MIISRVFRKMCYTLPIAMRRVFLCALAVACGALVIGGSHVARAESNAFFDVLQEELRATSATASADATSSAIIDPGASETVRVDMPVSQPSSRSEVYDAGRDEITGALAIFGGVFAFIAIAIIVIIAILARHSDHQIHS